MAHDSIKVCNTKGCKNPVLEGKYCRQCMQKRKETRNKVVAGAGGAAVLAGGAVIKKVGFKNIVNGAGKIVRLLLKI